MVVAVHPLQLLAMRVCGFSCHCSFHTQCCSITARFVIRLETLQNEKGWEETKQTTVLSHRTLLPCCTPLLQWNMCACILHSCSTQVYTRPWPQICDFAQIKRYCLLSRRPCPHHRIRPLLANAVLHFTPVRTRQLIATLVLTIRTFLASCQICSDMLC